MSNKWKKGFWVKKMGTLIHNTLNPSDLGPEFYNELKSLAPRHGLIKVMDEQKILARDFTMNDCEAMLDAINALITDPYIYFGSIEGNASDFGYWFDRIRMEEDTWEQDVIQGTSLEDLKETVINKHWNRCRPSFAFLVNNCGNISVYKVDAKCRLHYQYGVV